MDGLPSDTHGDYRGPEDDVYVGSTWDPSRSWCKRLINELVTWLRRSSQTSSLVRSALLHLNIIAIHPFNDGNGRTARTSRQWR